MKIQSTFIIVAVLGFILASCQSLREATQARAINQALEIDLERLIEIAEEEANR